jgi:hypothetical protein
MQVRFPSWVTAKSSLGDAKSSLGDAKSSLGDAESSLGDAKCSLGDATSSRWVTLRARWVTLRARWVMLTCSRGNNSAVRALITGGANLESHGWNEERPLHMVRRSDDG